MSEKGKDSVKENWDPLAEARRAILKHLEKVMRDE